MRKIPPLNWLRTFEAAARHLNFSLAAQELNVTQSAISQHIKLLESYINTPLFVRSPKKLKLTETGKQYLPLVSQAFLQLESATSDIFGGDKAVVRLHCDVSFSTLFIAPRLAGFQAAYPHIEIQLQHSVWWQRRLEVSANVPMQNALEVRFGDGNWNAPSIQLGDNTAFPVAGKAYPTSDFPALELTTPSLTQQRLFQLSGVRHNWRLWLLRAGVVFNNELSLNTVVQSDSSAALYSLAAHNQGLSLLSSVLTRHGLQNGELYQPFEYVLPIKEGFYLIKPNQYDSPEEQLFAEWLVESCR